MCQCISHKLFPSGRNLSLKHEKYSIRLIVVIGTTHSQVLHRRKSNAYIRDVDGEGSYDIWMKAVSPYQATSGTSDVTRVEIVTSSKRIEDAYLCEL